MTLLSTHPATPSSNHVVLAPGDALLVVDLQNDFLPGGALGIAGGDALLPVLRRYCECFVRLRLPIVFSRDWHPPRHCSFQEQGGIWPEHCVADSPGSLAPKQFPIPSTVEMIYKATSPDKDVYSVFEDTPLHELLQRDHVRLDVVGDVERPLTASWYLALVPGSSSWPVCTWRCIPSCAIFSQAGYRSGLLG